MPLEDACVLVVGEQLCGGSCAKLMIDRSRDHPAGERRRGEPEHRHTVGSTRYREREPHIPR